MPFIFEEHRKRGLLIFPILLQDVAELSFYQELDTILALPFINDNLTPIADCIVPNKATIINIFTLQDS